ncbi:hypothetical protein [Pseudomonas marginalis]|uniref:hypothetical protein n=1 Tax=Pseudomonas marginalis TaxID=298 RepID=UPI002A35FE17|nr:hypothetical protein [Pseudomonas marginalis]WPN21800.1 hypothetical protein QMK57_20605 [Pseudomonas marginalis]
MAVSPQEFRSPPIKACDAQCVLRLEQHVISLTSQLETAAKDVKNLTTKVEAVTLQQATFNGKFDKLPDSVGLASSYMTLVTIILAVVAMLFAGFVAWFQHKQAEKLHEMADNVRRDILSTIGSDPETINKISRVVVNSEQQLNNMVVMVNNSIGAAVKNELRNYQVVKGDDAGEVKLNSADPVSFQGLDLNSTREKSENA